MMQNWEKSWIFLTPFKRVNSKSKEISLKRYYVIFAIFFTFFFYPGQKISGQEVGDTLLSDHTDHTEMQVVDTAAVIVLSGCGVPVDTLFVPVHKHVPVFLPDPVKAIWYALICPGLGQIYNRSYWKVPVLYGGIATLSYLIIWNGRMYNDYQNAYHDISLYISGSNPYVDSFKPFFYNMPDADPGWMQSTLKRKRDFYRRNRDLSVFGMALLYIVSVVDAFVDAQLYNFSVSEDLSLQVEPVINNFFDLKDVPNQNMLGFRCTINF